MANDLAGQYLPPSQFIQQFRDPIYGRGGRSAPVLAIPETPAAPPPNVGLTPGYTPNFKQLIESDPAYTSWANDAQKSIADAAAQRRAALQALAINYGSLPSGFSDNYGDIDQNTLDLASKNRFSEAGKLQRSYDQGVEALKKALAARGALQSGDLGYGLDQANYQGPRPSTTSAVSSVTPRRATSTREPGARRRGERDQQAEQSVYANPDNRPTQGSEAHLDHDWQSKYGVPVYVGSDGSLYTLDGNNNPTPYTPTNRVATVPNYDTVPTTTSPTALGTPDTEPRSTRGTRPARAPCGGAASPARRSPRRGSSR
jgi:hypothetical protein